MPINKQINCCRIISDNLLILHSACLSICKLIKVSLSSILNGTVLQYVTVYAVCMQVHPYHGYPPVPDNECLLCV